MKALINLSWEQLKELWRTAARGVWWGMIVIAVAAILVWVIGAVEFPIRLVNGYDYMLVLIAIAYAAWVVFLDSFTIRKDDYKTRDGSVYKQISNRGLFTGVLAVLGFVISLILMIILGGRISPLAWITMIILAAGQAIPFFFENTTWAERGRYEGVRVTNFVLILLAAWIDLGSGFIGR